MLHLIAKELKDIELLGRVHTGGLLGRIREAEGSADLARELQKKLDSKQSDTQLMLAGECERLDNDIAALREADDGLQSTQQTYTQQLQAECEALRGATGYLYDCAGAYDAALSGDIVIAFPGGGFTEVSAAVLNAAVAGAHKESFSACLQILAGTLKHLWANFVPVLTPAEAVADPQVGVPTITGTPKFDKGRVLVEATFDTDAGATKTYADSGVLATGGGITCVAESLLVDGETVGPIPDGHGNVQTYEFNKSLTDVAAGNVAVRISAGDTAIQVADALRDAINNTPKLLVTASGTTATTSLTQQKTGAAPNGAIADTVDNGGFTTTAFTGGVDPEIVSVDVQVRADDTWLGHTVAQATMKFRIVA